MQQQQVGPLPTVSLAELAASDSESGSDDDRGLDSPHAEPGKQKFSSSTMLVALSSLDERCVIIYQLA